MDSEIMRIVQEAELGDKFEDVLKSEPDFKKQLLKIVEHYIVKTTCYSKKCEATAQQLLMTILKDNSLKKIHSARYRVKTVESLVTKYIKKKAMLPEVPGTDYNIEKYRPMDRNNYYKIITDLIGIRILVRYQQQWEDVHKWIWKNFYKEEKTYIKNWIEDYPSGETEDFIVEKPKLYLRDDRDLPLFQKFGKDIFEHHISKEGYNSIHYLLWYDGKYVEIQVRTIYDEAWGECTHDLVYKCKNKARRVELDRLSECLAIQTQAAGMISDWMFERAQIDSKKDEENEIEKSLAHCSPDWHRVRYESLEKCFQSMNSTKKKEEFNGSIDDLI